MLSAKLKEAAGNGLASTLYVDDVFSTWLYTGNGSTQTITNGIDLAGKGGMVWGKDRSSAVVNCVYDTARGATNALFTNLTNAQNTGYGDVTSFNSNGFSLNAAGGMNLSGDNVVAWTFRKAAKFFDVQIVSHTNGTANTIDLSTLATVGMVIAKITTTTGDWTVWQRGLTTGYNLKLNTLAEQSTTDAWLSVSGTTATLAAAAPTGTYVIYAYAHDTASTGIVQCGSYTGNGAEFGSLVNLGWEPQWVLVKQINNGTTTGWVIVDSMRGFCVEAGTENSGDALLFPYTSGAEIDRGRIRPEALGFTPRNLWNAASTNYMYMAIRRPNKPPTTGTQVFNPNVVATDLIGATTGFPVDLCFDALRGVSAKYVVSRLTGGNYLETNSTNNETINASDWSQSNTGINNNGIGLIGGSAVYWNFKRAPGFMDVVCFTYSGSVQTVPHNLTVVPELMIVKNRTGAADGWNTYLANLGNTSSLELQSTAATRTGFGGWGSTTPTASNFYIQIGASGTTYVAYLFATLAGISKVGSYTGNGTTQTINCGFTGGARFVLIKRTDSTGDWYVFDTARGMTTLTDPYLLLNSSAAEVATLGAVTSVTTGFAVNAAIVAAINTNAASYIYLSVA